MSVPSHTAVMAALAPVLDDELRLWTRSADAYVLLEDTGVSLPGCQNWVLSPVGASTPVGIRLVAADGVLVVTSQRPEAIARLLEQHPPEETDLPTVFFYLWVDPGRPVEPVPLSGAVRREADARVLCLDVQDRWRGRLRWSARTIAAGTHVTTTEVAE